MRRVAAILCLLIFWAPPVQADARDFGFASDGCSQFVTNLQVDGAKVRPLVPDRFAFSRDAIGKAAIGYRVHACPQMGVDGSPRSGVIWSELGVRITAPDGRLPDHIDTHAADGHDYYMLFLHANDAVFADAMRGIGAPAIHVPGMSYEPAFDELGGTLWVGEHVPAEGEYRVFVQTFTPETPRGMFPDFDVRAWYEGALGLIRYTDHRTSVTARFGRIDIHADPDTMLARLFGQTAIQTYDATVFFATDSVVETVDG